MKPFIFNQQEYTDLNSLGLAFVDQLDLALQCIKEKPFLKFFKKFKNHKRQIKHIFYQSKYLQSALSMLIYEMTEEHILYIGHRKYENYKDCLKEIRTNPALPYFVEDHGFTNTILPDVEDEKLKADLKAVEDNYTDELGFIYIEGYVQMDSTEPLDDRIKKLPKAQDPFKEAYELFALPEIQRALAYKYSLKEVLDFRKKKCPLFSCLLMVQDELENPLSILENSFYHSMLHTYKKWKYKGKEAKTLYKKLKALKGKFKKYSKLSYASKLLLEEQLYQLYLTWVTLYRLEKIIIQDEALQPTIPYCSTFVSKQLMEEHSYVPDEIPNPEEPVLPLEYDLNRFYKSLKTHRNFSIWTIVIAMVSVLFYISFVFLDSLRIQIGELLAQVMQVEATIPATGIASKTNLMFFIGAGLALLMAIFILSIRMAEKGKYKGLCKLAFYRKNEHRLKEKDRLEYERVKQNEAKYVKHIDRFYRFYGGIGMAGLSLCVVLTVLGIVYGVAPIWKEDWIDTIASLLSTRLYFIFIAPAVCMLLSFARHKKTAWSCIFTQWISILLAIGTLFIPL